MLREKDALILLLVGVLHLLSDGLNLFGDPQNSAFDMVIFVLASLDHGPIKKETHVQYWNYVIDALGMVPEVEGEVAKLCSLSSDLRGGAVW
jgi:hypothetical protein